MAARSRVPDGGRLTRASWTDPDQGMRRERTHTVRALVFDLGGVLLPFDQTRRNRQMSDALGIDEASSGAFVASIAERLDRGELGLDDLAEMMSQLGRRDVSADQAKEHLLSVFLPPNAALWDLSASLRPHLITAALSDNPACVRDVFPRPDAFDHVFLSAELGATKPTVEVFVAVTQALGLEPDQIAFVDDSEPNIRAAVAFGWDGILYSTNEQLKADLALRGILPMRLGR